MPGNGSLAGSRFLLATARSALRRAASASVATLAKKTSATLAASALRNATPPVCRTGYKTTELAKLGSRCLPSSSDQSAANYEYKIEEMHCFRVKPHDVLT